jgi:type I restriction enzyme S subunit
VSIRTTKLGDVVDVLSGFAFKSEFFGDAAGFPIIRIRDVVRGYTDTYYAGPYTEQFVVQNGDIIIGMDGNFNAAKWQGGPALLNQRVCKVTAKAQLIDEGYLFHYLPIVLKKIEDATPFVTVKHLSAGDLKGETIPLPPLPEQRRIAAILDKADALRTKRREALAQLDRLAQSIFVEMFGSYKKGHIHWKTVPLGELATEMKIGLVRNSEEFGDAFSTPYVRMNSIGRSGEFIPELVQRTNVTDEELDEYRLEAGDLLFNTRNSKELVGKTAIFRETGDYVYNNNLMRIRLDERVDAEYVAQCFLTSFIQQELEFRKSGTTSVFAIYGRDLNTIPIPLPPIRAQREFGERMQKIAAMRKTMNQGEDAVSGMFASLQHRAFRGEL